MVGGSDALATMAGGLPVTSANRRIAGRIVRCLCEDREGGLWVATRDGRVLFLRDDVFTAFTNACRAA